MRQIIIIMLIILTLTLFMLNGCSSGTTTATNNQQQCTPYWKCNAWSSCQNNIQIRTCTDSNYCDTASGKPQETRTCTAPAQPSPPSPEPTPEPKTCPPGYYLSLSNNQCVLSDSNKPVYLILTTSQLYSTANTLADYRRLEYGVEVIIVDGKSKEQIKSVINSRSNVKYVLIIGTSNSIPADDVSDNYYADYDSDSNRRPEIIIGRIPSDNPSAVSSVIQKTKNYEAQNTFGLKKIVFVGGSEWRDCSKGWKTGCYFDAEVVPQFSGWSITKIYCGCENTDTNCATNKQQAISAFNSGQSIIAYRGHGGGALHVGCSRAYNMNLGASDLQSLSNNVFPVFIAFSCSTVTFNNPNYFSTSLLFGNEKGIVAYIGSAVDGGDFPKSIWENMRTKNTLGEAFKEAKQTATATANFNHQLLGDPALKLR